METKSLEAFVAVYECRSMSKAAERLFISHQGLSKRIDTLEADLGAILFERSNRGVVPTTAARTLYPQAVRITGLVEAMYSSLAGSHPREPLLVACTSGGLTYDLPRFKRDFAKSHPDIDLRIEEGNDRSVAEQVASGAAECGLLAGPVDHARFSSWLITRYPHVLVVGEGDPLAAKRSISLSDLEGRRIALIGPGFAPFDYMQDRLARARVTPAEIIGVAEIATGFRLSASADILTVTADFTALPHEPQGTRVLPFDDPDVTWDISLIQRREAPVNERVEQMRDFALEWSRSVARGFTWRRVWQPRCN